MSVIWKRIACYTWCLCLLSYGNDLNLTRFFRTWTQWTVRRSSYKEDSNRKWWEDLYIIWLYPSRILCGSGSLTPRRDWFFWIPAPRSGRGQASRNDDNRCFPSFYEFVYLEHYNMPVCGRFRLKNKPLSCKIDLVKWLSSWVVKSLLLLEFKLFIRKLDTRKIQEFSTYLFKSHHVYAWFMPHPNWIF